MPKKPYLRPSHRTPISGIYGEVGPRGGKTGEECDSTKRYPIATYVTTWQPVGTG